MTYLFVNYADIIQTIYTNMEFLSQNEILI